MAVPYKVFGMDVWIASILAKLRQIAKHFFLRTYLWRLMSWRLLKSRAYSVMSRDNSLSFETYALDPDPQWISQKKGDDLMSGITSKWIDGMRPVLNVTTAPIRTLIPLRPPISGGTWRPTTSYVHEPFQTYAVQSRMKTSRKWRKLNEEIGRWSATTTAWIISSPSSQSPQRQRLLLPQCLSKPEPQISPRRTKP